MIVISLIGPSAAGKSSITRRLAEKASTLRESYIELDKYKLDNRSTLSKWQFMASWFDRVLDIRHAGVPLVVTDRSPLCAAAYVTRGQEEYFQLALHSLDELAALEVHCYPVLLTARLDVLLQRTESRLLAEPWRARFNEQDPSRADEVRSYFVSKASYWTSTIDTSELSIFDVQERVEGIIREVSDRNHFDG